MDESLPLIEERVCSICLEPFENPIILPCMHLFCTRCLCNVFQRDFPKAGEVETGGLASGENLSVQSVSQRALHCPYCRDAVPLGTQDASAVSKNFTVSNVASKYKVTIVEIPLVMCSLCEDEPKPAFRTCMDCPGISYCKDCLSICHPLRGPFKKHRLVDPGSSSAGQTEEYTKDDFRVEDKTLDQRGASSKDDGMQCKIATEQVWRTFYCFTCVECFTTTSEFPPAHVDHDLKELDDAVAEKKKLMLSNLKLLQEARQTQVLNMVNIQDKEVQVQEQIAKTSAKVQKVFLELKEVLERKEQEIQKGLTDHLRLWEVHTDKAGMKLVEIDDIISSFQEVTSDLDLNGKLAFVQEDTLSSLCERILTKVDDVHEQENASCPLPDLDNLKKKFESAIDSVFKEDNCDQVPVIEYVKCTTSTRETVGAQVRWNICDMAQTYNLKLVTTSPEGRQEELLLRNLTDKDASACNISPLRTDRTYLVAVSAVFAGCESQYSEAVTLTTTPIYGDQQGTVPAIKSVREVLSNSDTTKLEVTVVGCAKGKHYRITLVSVPENDAKEEAAFKFPAGSNYSCSWTISGLRYTTTYNVSVEEALFDKERLLPQPVRITTGKKIKCPGFHLDPDDRHSDVILDGKHLNAADKRCETNLIELSQPRLWSNGCGVAGSQVLVGSELYWEARVEYEILRDLDEGDVLADIGIGECVKLDSVSPSSKNRHCICCSVCKQIKSQNIALQYWNGSKMKSDRNCSVCFAQSPQKSTAFTVGFFIDFDAEMFRLVHVDSNTLLHVFSALSLTKTVPFCEFYNPEKVKMKVRFITGNEILKIPSCIRSSII